jgi:hypothetical protein
MLELKVVNEDKIVKLQFEHSLRSLSKWESKHKVAFLANREKTPAEMLDYYQCMIVSSKVDPNLVYMLEPEQMEELTKYINTDQTASSVPSEGPPQYNPEVTTSELVYFWMVALKINWEAQDWHFSRLMMLIQITSYKQQPPKKRNIRETITDMRAENERRKKMFNTSG